MGGHGERRHGDGAVQDAERSPITGDKLFLCTAKTGTPVCVPLPDFALTALEAVPRVS